MLAPSFEIKDETTASQCPLDEGRLAAERGIEAAHRFLQNRKNRPEIECALRIRAVENVLYELFGKGKLHGTIHTCIGQEFSGALVGRYLRATDFVTSNHRCHGHFIAATGNWCGLIDELIGNKDGICAGIGSSQHLWARNFMSNGQQGGLLPVAAGLALHRKSQGEAGVVISFIGEGTLGEGIVYEALNLAALWSLPHLIVCENNFYSQSTPQEMSVSGSILSRAAAFGLRTYAADTWDLERLDSVLEDALAGARSECRPALMALKTYRLNPHSKGDDQRDRAEVDWFRAHDPVTMAIRDYEPFQLLYEQYVAEATEASYQALSKPALSPEHYFSDQLPRVSAEAPVTWSDVPTLESDDQRIAQQLNSFYRHCLESDQQTVFLGEDIADPYGGAFKISKGMTTDFPTRVRTTPISEAAICGVGIGLAVAGHRAFVEIMFGDFITYAFDQILNNASKMFHMYNRNLDCPVVIRTPMGARRGYGPTHSQSLERFLIGIDNCCTVSLHSLAAVSLQLGALRTLPCPTILLENKIDYGVTTYQGGEGFYRLIDGERLPTVLVRAENATADVTIFTYGGMARFVANSLLTIFQEADAVPEMIVPTCISPLNLNPVIASLEATGRLVIVEEGVGYGSVGAEVLAQLSERRRKPFRMVRVSGKATPIPSAPSLEAAALPGIEEICAAVRKVMECHP